MKVCFSTLGCSEKNLDEVLSLADRFPVTALEFRGLNNEMDNQKIKDFQREAAEDTKAKCRAAGVRPLVLGTSCAFHDSEEFEAMMEEGRQNILIARRMGIPYIRVFGNSVVGDIETCTAQVARGIGELCGFAEDKDVTVLLEVHGDFNTAERLMPIIQTLKGRENFGLTWDVYHTHLPYGNNWTEFYRAMAPYIRHIHIKDYDGKQLVLPGDGEIAIVPIVKQLLDDGYTGYFSLEWERKWYPELPELEMALERLFILFSVFSPNLL